MVQLVKYIKWPPFRNIDLLIIVKTGCSDLANMTLRFSHNVEFDRQHMD
jgi:hypothetical protein